jgi:hypothetical protein
MRDHEHYWFGLWIGASVGRAQADSKGKGDERAVFRRELRKKSTDGVERDEVVSRKVNSPLATHFPKRAVTNSA